MRTFCKRPLVFELKASAARNVESVMSKDGIKGATQKAAGSIKEGLGKATGDDKLVAKGAADKVAGSAKETVGKAKDVVHKATK